MKKVRKSIVYRRCEDFAAILVNLGYTVISWRDLRYLIMRNIGGDARTIRKYREALIEFGFLEVQGNRFLLVHIPHHYQKTLTEEVETSEK